MSDLPPDALAEIARVTDAATPGPWHWVTDARWKNMLLGGVNKPEWKAYGWTGIRVLCDPTDGPTVHDCAFIALARTAIPDLLAALTAKDEEIARLRARFLESCKHQRGAQRHIDDLEVELFQVASERDLARQQVEELRKALDLLEAAMDKRFDDINDPDWGAIPSEWWEARATGGSIIRYVVQQELTAARQLLARIETP